MIYIDLIISIYLTMCYNTMKKQSNKYHTVGQKSNIKIVERGKIDISFIKESRWPQPLSTY